MDRLQTADTVQKKQHGQQYRGLLDCFNANYLLALWNRIKYFE
jgi:hypothetical protein